MLIKRHARVANNDTTTQFECEADDSLSSSASNRVLQNTVYHLSHDSRDIISNPPDATCIASIVQSAQQQHHIAMVAFCIRSPPSKALRTRALRQHSASTSQRHSAPAFRATCFQSTLASPGRRKRIIVAVTGATGAPLAVELLQRLRQLNIETHLILSKWGAATLKYELEPPNNTSRYLDSLADFTYSPRDVSASLSSGSFLTHGMIVVPCSMKTLAAIRIGYDSELITRAAGVCLKERRKLVLAARETPLSTIHLENMLEVTRAGALIFPPVMTFYTRPKGVEDMVKQSAMRMIDCLGIPKDENYDEAERWSGFDWQEKKNSA
jgi:4-hydroxy-3-polyprenylbenzoate decarboxylase